MNMYTAVDPTLDNRQHFGKRLKLMCQKPSEEGYKIGLTQFRSTKNVWVVEGKSICSHRNILIIDIHYIIMVKISEYYQ